MGLFGKKKTKPTKEDSDSQESQNIESEMEQVRTEYREKQEELNDIRQKIEMVKDEYDATVSSLMSVKKELNHKRLELDVATREYLEIGEKIKKSKEITDSRKIDEFDRTEDNLQRIRKDLKMATGEYDTVKKKMADEQLAIRIIRDQHAEYEKELEEARIKLYNAKAELEKQDHFQDANILTPKEKDFIQGEDSSQKSSAGIIEAASAVVGSLKSKLSMTQKELEAVQLLLEKERDEHEKTRQKLKETRKNS